MQNIGQTKIHHNRSVCTSIKQEELEQTFQEALEENQASKEQREELVQATYTHLIEMKHLQPDAAKEALAQKGESEANRAEYLRYQAHLRVERAPKHSYPSQYQPVSI